MSNQFLLLRPNITVGALIICLFAVSGCGGIRAQLDSAPDAPENAPWPLLKNARTPDLTQFNVARAAIEAEAVRDGAARVTTAAAAPDLYDIDPVAVGVLGAAAQAASAGPGLTDAIDPVAVVGQARQAVSVAERTPRAIDVAGLAAESGRAQALTAAAPRSVDGARLAADSAQAQALAAAAPRSVDGARLAADSAQAQALAARPPRLVSNAAQPAAAAQARAAAPFRPAPPAASEVAALRARVAAQAPLRAGAEVGGPASESARARAERPSRLTRAAAAALLARADAARRAD